VLKAVLAGASVAMLASALLLHGIERLAAVLDCLRDWMARRDYHSLGILRGVMSFMHVANPAAYERGNYVRQLSRARESERV
jgi:dihydroorotate dehydrogenase (fumarate)